MEKSPDPRGIEFEEQRQMLQSERTWARRGGLAQIIIGTAAGVAGILLSVLFFISVHFPPLSIDGFWLVFFLLVLITISFPPVVIVAGLKTLRKGEQPITPAEIEARRQEERSQLFAQARGELPHEYTRQGRRNVFLAGSAMTIFFTITLVAFWNQPFPLFLFGYVLGTGGVISGLLFMVLPFLYNQRAADALRHLSVQRLRSGLTHEEYVDPGQETSDGSEH